MEIENGGHLDKLTDSNTQIRCATNFRIIIRIYFSFIVDMLKQPTLSVELYIYYLGTSARGVSPELCRFLEHTDFADNRIVTSSS